MQNRFTPVSELVNKSRKMARVPVPFSQKVFAPTPELVSRLQNREEDEEDDGIECCICQVSLVRTMHKFSRLQTNVAYFREGKSQLME